MCVVSNLPAVSERAACTAASQLFLPWAALVSPIVFVFGERLQQGLAPEMLLLVAGPSLPGKSPMDCGHLRERGEETPARPQSPIPCCLLLPAATPAPPPWLGGRPEPLRADPLLLTPPGSAAGFRPCAMPSSSCRRLCRLCRPTPSSPSWTCSSWPPLTSHTSPAAFRMRKSHQERAWVPSEGMDTSTLSR